jgi:hypothetical protein
MKKCVCGTGKANGGEQNNVASFNLGLLGRLPGGQGCFGWKVGFQRPYKGMPSFPIRNPRTIELFWGG